MKKKTFSIVLSLILVVGLLVGCSNASTNSDTASTPDNQSGDTADTTDTGNKNGSTFTYAIGGDPGNNINFVATHDRFGLMTLKMVASPLYTIGEDGSINYYLADDVSISEDGLVYTVKLKEDALWSDGEPVTADDVVFTINAIHNEGTLLTINGEPIKAEATDEHTVTFTLPSVSASALELLSAEVFIAPKHIYEGKDNLDTNILSDTLVGTGPYILEEYKTGEYLKFVKNPNYFKGEPKIDTIVYRIVENSETAKLAIQNGEVDAWIGLPSDIESLQNVDSLNVTTYSEGRVAYLRLNRVSSKLQDADFRKGIFYALNRDEIITATYLSTDYAKPNYSFLPYVNSYYSEDIEKYEQDQAKAKELIAKSGITDTLKLCYIISDSAQEKQALTIQAELKQVGVNVELAGVDSAAWTSAQDKDNQDYDMFLGGYIMGVDPDSHASLFDSTSDNNMNFNNSKIDELFAKGKTELDSSARKEIYNEVQKAIADEALFYPITSNLRVLITNKKVKGIEEAGLVPIYTFEDPSQLYIE